MRKDDEFEVARVNIVSFLDVLSPDSDKGLILFNITYKEDNKITNKYIYPQAHIGNSVGNKVITMTVRNPRQLRALAILSSGIDAIKRIDNNHYKVKSQYKNSYYDVVFKKGTGWTCTCPNYQEYHQDCKHIYASQFSAQLRLETEREIKPHNTLEIQEIIECPHCIGHDIVKNGVRKCKKGDIQRYLCRGCSHRFVVDKALSRLKATPEVISVSMDLYFKGNSLAKISHHLNMFYQIKVTRPTILNWVHKFSKILNEYSEKHKPEVGDIWNSDEMTVNIKKEGVKKNNEWIWNLMDSSTRFLLASTITKQREVKDATDVLTQGKERAGKKPKALITDGLQSYNQANVNAFYNRHDPTIHYRTPSKRKHFLNQNIERLNGTIRERLKVMRGLDDPETAQAILDGERFYYNHIRPHMSLNGMTPAQVAGLPSAIENPWLTYLKIAVRL